MKHSYEHPFVPTHLFHLSARTVGNQSLDISHTAPFGHSDGNKVVLSIGQDGLLDRLTNHLDNTHVVSVGDQPGVYGERSRWAGVVPIDIYLMSERHGWCCWWNSTRVDRWGWNTLLRQESTWSSGACEFSKYRRESVLLFSRVYPAPVEQTIRDRNESIVESTQCDIFIYPGTIDQFTVNRVNYGDWVLLHGP